MLPRKSVDMFSAEFFQMFLPRKNKNGLAGLTIMHTDPLPSRTIAAASDISLRVSYSA